MSPAVERGPWNLIASLIGIGLGLMLLYAALVKAADPGLFAEQIRSYGILPGLAGFGAYFFVLAETILALALIVGPLPRPAFLAFALLMFLFIGATAWTWAHGNVSGCGCFGRLASRTPMAVILEDSGYLVLGLAAVPFSPWIRGVRLRWIVLGVCLVIFLPLALLAPRLPVDSLVTKVGPGTDLQNLAAQDLKYPLGEGRVFVVLLGERCSACDQAVPMMEALQKMDGAPRVTAIFAGDRAQKRAWALERVPEFPVGQAPVKALRQYYRTLPVFLLLDQGKVRRVWWDRAPRPEEVVRSVG